FAFSGAENFFKFLGKTDHRNVSELELSQLLQGGVELSFSAVD
ncbi:MAG: hypothetical protein JWM99_4503, partial [Verrucomicrobiales bacterium]|nr:hypothetical protein [Verrucomicrobiales bacterium]